MRSVGFDIAKVGFCAAGLAVDGDPRRCSAWRVSNERMSEPEQLEELEIWVKRVLWIYKPDIVVVEELAVFMNKNTIRTLARREGVILLTAKKNATIVIHRPVSQSRRIALGKVPGKGSMSKDEAWKRVRKMYPDFNFGHANQGGMDKGDAMTHALAGPIILERR